MLKEKNIRGPDIKRILTTLCLTTFLVSTGVCLSADFQKGFDAHERGDYATALKEFAPLAEQGDARAQTHLGLFYDKGLGVPQNYWAAVMWYTLAAEQGNASAQYSLGLMYAEERGVPQDYKTALKWYRLAAAQGHADPRFDLVFRYARAQGVIQDNVYAHMWWNIAASTGEEETTKKQRFCCGKKATLTNH